MSSILFIIEDIVNCVALSLAFILTIIISIPSSLVKVKLTDAKKHNHHLF
jgi:hypothetical protein